MRRFSRLLPLVAVLLLGLATASWAGTDTQAQDATPAAEDAVPEGTSYELVGLAQGVAVPSPVDLVAVRLGLDPGAGFPIEDTDPTSGMLIVESGTFTVRVEAAWTITRGAGMAEAVATAEATGDFAALGEEIAAGEEVALEAGDTAYIPGSVNGEIRNDGQERAVGLAFLVAPSEAMMTEATPAP